MGVKREGRRERQRVWGGAGGSRDGTGEKETSTEVVFRDSKWMSFL